MNFIYKNRFRLIQSLLIFLIIIIFFYSKIIYLYIWPVIKNNQEILFADMQNILDSSKCYRQFDIYTHNPCTILGGNPYSYGSFSLKLPNVAELYNFYLIFFPLLMIFLFTLITLNIFKPKKKLDYLKVLLIIFSTPVMLGFERGQSEMLIFIIFFLISYMKNIFFESLLIIFLSSIKFYPAISYAVYFNRKIDVKFIFNSFFFFFFVFLIFYFEKDNINKIIGTMSRYTFSGMIERMGLHIFSLDLLPELFRLTITHTKIFPELSNKVLVYIYNSFLFIISIFYIFFISKFFVLKKNHYINFDLKKYEDKLFILCGLVIGALYLLTQSHSYKEIYFLGLIPFLLQNIKKENYPFIKIIYNLIIIKFILLTFLWILQTNYIDKSLIFKGFNILIKGLIDYFIMLYIYFYLLVFFKKFIMNNFKSN